MLIFQKQCGVWKNIRYQFMMVIKSSNIKNYYHTILELLPIIGYRISRLREVKYI